MNNYKGKMTPYCDEYDSCMSTYATLAIYSTDASCNVDVITQRLDATPSFSRRKGEERVNQLGRTHVSSRDVWIWSTKNKLQSRDLRRHIDMITQLLQGKEEFLADLQDSNLVKMRVHCSWVGKGSGGPTLWPEQMSSLAKLDLELSIEVDVECEDEKVC